MMPPTSIDGTDITGATIDGTDVTEITVDGDTVFTAEILPVAYTNLVAWYPFDSATYGGSNADDVTAIIGGSGDDTPFDATVNGANYVSSGGVTDIEAGPNSGAFEFTSPQSTQTIRTDTAITYDTASVTAMAWAKTDQTNQETGIISADQSRPFEHLRINIQNGVFLFFMGDGSNSGGISGPSPNFSYQHVAIVGDGNSVEAFVDGNSVGTNSVNKSTLTDQIEIGNDGERNRGFDGEIDDVRIYNRALTQTEIQTIISNTQP